MVNQASRRRFLKHASVGAMGMSTLAAVANAKRATRIDSCTTITKPGEYELAADITHTGSGVCIHIRADDVTLDGKGFALRGPRNFSSTGISTMGNVEVRSLEVRDFTYGFNVPRPRGRFENVVSVHNRISGFNLWPDAERTRITDSDISYNGSAAIGAVKADGHTILNNRIRSNSTGIVFRQGVSGATVRGNDVSFNRQRGITAWEGGDRNRIADNVVRNNGINGISVNDFNPEPASKLTIRRNTVAENGSDGVFLRQVDDSKVIRNTVRRNGDDGIELEDSNENRLIRNVVCDNGDNAIVIGPNSMHNRLRANTTEC